MTQGTVTSTAVRAVAFPLRRARRVRAHRHERALAELRAASEVGLHLGCGGQYIPGMINADAFDDSVRDVSIDALDLRDYADGTVDLIENHHMFEHLDAEQAREAVREWHRALRPGGRLVITCPDLDAVARRWLTSSHQTRFHAPQSPVVTMIYGSQEHPGMFHRWGYNQRSIRELLVDSGFTVERQVSPFPPGKLTPSMLTVAVKV